MDWQARLTELLDHDWFRWYLLPGLVAALVAITGLAGERRRKRRSDPDAVGLLDWVSVAFWASFVALVLFAGAFQLWLKT